MHTYCVNIVQVKHRGQILRDAISNSGLSVTDVAKRIKKSRRVLYNYFEKDVGIDILLRIAEVIGKQYFEDVPEIRNARINQTPEFIECIKEKEQLKVKIEHLSDELIQLHRENKQLILKIANFEKTAYNVLNEPQPKLKRTR